MPRTKITKAQTDDYGAKYLPSRRAIRRECAKIRKAWVARGAKRKKDEPGGIREVSAGDLGLSEPFEVEE